MEEKLLRIYRWFHCIRFFLFHVDIHLPHETELLRACWIAKSPSHTCLVSKLRYYSEREINVYYIKNNHHSPLNDWMV